MQIVTGALQRDSARDNFWTKVEFVSDKLNRRTNVLLCASYEYLSARFKTDKLNEQIVNDWLVAVVSDLRQKGDTLFDVPTHIEVRAITSEGYQNGVAFLEEKINEDQA